MRPVTKRRLGTFIAALGLTGTVLGLAGPPASAVEGPDVEPILVEITANVTCGELDDTYGGGQTWLEVKFDSNELADGTIGGVTLDWHGDNTFDWSSTMGIDAVYVKSGSGGSNLYLYAPTAASPESFGDDGLTSPQGISHISFCYDVSDPTTTTSTSTSTTSTSTTSTSTTSTSTSTSTTSTSTTSTSTTSTSTTSTLPETTTTTEPGEVIGTSIVPTTTAPTEVAGVQVPRPLPRTGGNVGPLVALSLGLLVVGIGFVVAGDGTRTLGFRRR